MILHIDMDAFFASIEQAINPRLKGKPLIVGSRGNKLHTVVCAASYEAKAFGIGSGMSSVEAIKLCPNLEFVPADQNKYIWTSEQIYSMLKDYGFSVVYASIDEFRIDVPDKIDYENLAKDIQKRIQQTFDITASIGISHNCLLAKLASKLNKPRGIAILKEVDLEEALAKVPVEKLCGVGEKTSLILHALGIKTCLELYQKNASFLEANLGQFGLNLYTGLHSRETLDTLEENQAPKSIGHSYTFPRASENPGFIRGWIRLLSEMVARRLREANLSAKTIHLWLNGPEIGSNSFQQTFQITTNDGFEVFQRTLKIVARTGQKRPKIRALGITASGFLASEEPLFIEEKRRRELLKTIDKINAKLGEETIYPAIITLTRKLK